jgi:hypothetical protein
MTNGSDLISKIYAMMEKHKEVKIIILFFFPIKIIFINY